MKRFKILFFISCLAVALTVGLIISNALSPKTVDFNGRLTDITAHGDGAYTLTAESVFGGERSFVVDGKSSLKDLYGNSISISELSIGDDVLINYRATLFKSKDFPTVKDLTRYKENKE